MQVTISPVKSKFQPHKIEIVFEDQNEYDTIKRFVSLNITLPEAYRKEFREEDDYLVVKKFLTQISHNMGLVNANQY